MEIVLTIPDEGVMGYSPEQLLAQVKDALYDWRRVDTDPFIESARLEPILKAVKPWSCKFVPREDGLLHLQLQLVKDEPYSIELILTPHQAAELVVGLWREAQLMVVAPGDC